jgi:hypothetical protein
MVFKPLLGHFGGVLGVIVLLKVHILHIEVKPLQEFEEFIT